MTNALEELQASVGLYDDIVCAEIKLDAFGLKKEINLKLNYTKTDLTLFLNELKNIDYDSDFGRQQLYGTVWLTNNRWLERMKYEGSEWWEYKYYPKIPSKLK